jgi:hypothetical protein
MLHYLKNHNAKEAALAAGYAEGSAYVKGSQLLATTKIQAAISEHLRPLIASADQVQARISEVAFNNALDYYGNDGQLKYAELKEKGYLVSEFDASEGLHKAKVKFQPQMQALALLGKVHGLFVERQEVSGPLGGPLQHALSLAPEQQSKFAAKEAKVEDVK